MRFILGVLLTVLVFSAVALAADKPVVVVTGEGNLEINSDGSAAYGWGWAVASRSTRVNKHNQTMEMAQNFLKYCPDLEVSVDARAIPDYYVALNREGGLWNIGQSQIMLLNRQKTVIYVAKKMTVKTAVRSTCKAITEDWEVNGRLAVPNTAPAPPAFAVPPVTATSFNSSRPEVGGSLCGKWFNCAADPELVGTTNQVALSSAAAATDTTHEKLSPTPTIVNAEAAPKSKSLRAVTLDLQTTARAREHCDRDTVKDMLSDLRAYLTVKGVALGRAADADFRLAVIIDRPLSKRIEITVQAWDNSTGLLWSEQLADPGWNDMGDKQTVRALDRIHQIIDTKLGAQNGLPQLVGGSK